MKREDVKREDGKREDGKREDGKREDVTFRAFRTLISIPGSLPFDHSSQENNMPARRPNSKPAASKSARTKASSGRRATAAGPRLYTLDVWIMTGPISKKFVKKNPKISRTIEIRGDQTLEDLHEAIFDAFDRFDPHMKNLKPESPSPRSRSRPSTGSRAPRGGR